MSTIRRHGVAFHLIPTPEEDLWLEVIRESDGAVLASEKFRGESDDDLAPAVEEWFDDIVLEWVNGISIASCRWCKNRRRPERRLDDGRIERGYLAEWEFDLCMACAAHLEQTVPWMGRFLQERYSSSEDDEDEASDDW